MELHNILYKGKIENKLSKILIFIIIIIYSIFYGIPLILPIIFLTWIMTKGIISRIAGTIIFLFILFGLIVSIIGPATISNIVLKYIYHTV